MKVHITKSYKVMGSMSSMKCMSFVKRFKILVAVPGSEGAACDKMVLRFHPPMYSPARPHKGFQETGRGVEKGKGE